MEKTKFWEEAPGQQSVTRLMFVAMIITALYVAIYQTIILPTHSFDIGNLTSLITLACGLKLWQKSQEVKFYSASDQKSKPEEVK